MGRVSRLRKIRIAGLVLMIIGAFIGLMIYLTAPLTTTFVTYYTTGSSIFIIGSLLFMAYEVFVPEFWKGEWAPGPGHKYPEENK